MLRAASECADLIVADSNSEWLNLHVPIRDGVKGVVGLTNGQLLVRLKSRKNSIFGDTVCRTCVCRGAEGVSGHIPAPLCPVHALWPWIVKYRKGGQRVFCENISKSASSFLKTALRAREVAGAENYGLHSLRRGAAQSLVDSGSSLATLLRAGGWKSSAFTAYLDFAGIENSAFSKHAEQLLDLDEHA